MDDGNWPQILTRLVSTLCVIFLSGCQDQRRVNERLFWADANIGSRHHVYDEFDYPKVEPGDKTILLINDGLTHGRYSSAHGSHQTILLALPRGLREGDIHELLVSEGQIKFSGFAGYSFQFMDPHQQGTARIEIKEVAFDEITAYVAVEITAVRESINRPSDEWPRFEVVRDKTYTFKRSELKATSACCNESS